MLRYLHARHESTRVLAALVAKNTRVVTLALTGDGYPVDLTGGIPEP